MPALRDTYDIAIIGAGPAGLNAALTILDHSPAVSLLLVDKTTPWDHPIACAEAVGRLGFHEALMVDQSWIRFVIGNAAFHAPDRTSLVYQDKNKGYIIDRAKMQCDLADRCRERGAHCVFGRRVVSVSQWSASTRDIVFDDVSTVRARVVIDASGPLSCFGRGEEITWKSTDLEPAYFAVVKNVSLGDDTVHIHVGRDLAPGGYAWVFPREEGVANIGVLVGRAQCGRVNLRALLSDFLRTHYPQGQVVRYFAGTIPCGYRRSNPATLGLIKAGDAAGTINPISRAGITEALISGAIAGKHALQMLNAQTEATLKRICARYERAWFDKRGKRHMKLANAKAALATVPDEDYNRAARALTSVSRDDLTMSKIFRLSLGRFPRLVWAMRHLM